MLTLKTSINKFRPFLNVRSFPHVSVKISHHLFKPFSTKISLTGLFFGELPHQSYNSLATWIKGTEDLLEVLLIFQPLIAKLEGKQICILKSNPNSFRVILNQSGYPEKYIFFSGTETIDLSGFSIDPPRALAHELVHAAFFEDRVHIGDLKGDVKLKVPAYLVDPLVHFDQKFGVDRRKIITSPNQQHFITMEEALTIGILRGHVSPDGQKVFWLGDSKVELSDLVFQGDFNKDLLADYIIMRSPLSENTIVSFLSNRLHLLPPHVQSWNLAPRESYIQ
mgnify:CR=1 FL=1